MCRQNWLKFGKILALGLLLTLTFTLVKQAAANSGDEPIPVVDHSQEKTTKDESLKRVDVEEMNFPTAMSVPDAYGYIWDDGQPYSWSDISASGSSAGLEDVDDGYSGPISLGFTFPFYEQAYNQLYISSNGFLSFESGSSKAKNTKIPFVDEPNAIVAPFWDDLEIGNRNSGNVYYQAFSDHFIVSFDEIAARATYTQTVTFQVVLYETGNICYRYKELNGELTSATVGIEDRDGVTGLSYLYNAPGLKDLEAANALCFNRPPDNYRVKTIPEYQGGFIGETNQFEVSIINTGDLGPDSFELDVQQTNINWQIELLDSSGNLITKDTNGNDKVETPILGENEVFVVTVKVTAPVNGQIGANTLIDLTALSLGDSNQKRTAQIHSAIPASFVQSLTTRVRIDLRMITAEKTLVSTIFPLFTGSTLGVQNFSTYNYMVFWERNGQKFDPNIGLFTDIEHAVASDFGMLLLPAVKTTSNYAATSSSLWIYDSNPVSAVTPDGRVAFVWIRDLIDFSDPLNSKTNSNVYLVILDQNDTRNVINGPINITNNLSWDNTPDVPRYFTPHLAATSNNRFFVVWTDEKVDALGRLISNIDLAVFDSSGTQVTASKKYPQLTSTVTNGLLYQDPAVYGLQGGRVILGFSEKNLSTGKFRPGYAILENNGNNYLDPQYLAGVEARYPISHQLASGPIIFAMTRTDQAEIAFSLISHSNFQSSVVTNLSVIDGLAGDYVSITEDKNGYGILTWLDTDLERNLYYALIDASGNIVTPAMPFYQANADNSIAISESGRGNAAYDPRLGVYLPLIFK